MGSGDTIYAQSFMAISIGVQEILVFASIISKSLKLLYLREGSIMYAVITSVDCIIHM